MVYSMTSCSATLKITRMVASTLPFPNPSTCPKPSPSRPERPEAGSVVIFTLECEPIPREERWRRRRRYNVSVSNSASFLVLAEGVLSAATIWSISCNPGHSLFNLSYWPKASSCGAYLRRSMDSFPSDSSSWPIPSNM
jgi:hypothetical protein